MSRTKARVISSLRMRRCSQRRNRTNCTPVEMMAVNTPYQWVGMEFLWSAAACRRFSCGRGEWLRVSRFFFTRVNRGTWLGLGWKKSGSKLPHTPRLEKRAGESAERGAQAGAERGEESAAVAARGIRAHVQQFRGDAESAAEEICVHTEEAGESLQRGHLALKGGVGEGQLILLGLAGLRNSLLAREFVGQLAESGGVARAREAVLRGLLERIEGAGEGALRLAGHRGFVRRAQAGIVQYALVLRQEHVPDLLLLAEKLLIERVDAGALLIGHFARDVLREHRDERQPESLIKIRDELVARHLFERAVIAEALLERQMPVHVVGVPPGILQIGRAHV